MGVSRALLNFRADGRGLQYDRVLFPDRDLRRLFVLKQTIVANAQTLLLTLLGIFAYREPLTWIVAVGLVLVFGAVWLAGAEKQSA